jgi:hypothetical protein
MKRSLMILIVAAAIGSVACDSGGKSGSGSTKETAAAEGDDATPKGEMPVPEDYEEEAQKKVTQETYEDQLAGLEKEIDGDKE